MFTETKSSLDSKLQMNYLCSVRISNTLKAMAKKELFNNQKNAQLWIDGSGTLDYIHNRVYQ